MTSWKQATIGTLCTTFSGGTPSTSHPEYYGGDIPWIASGDLNQGRIRSVNGRITKLGLERSSAKLVKAGTPLIALYGATAGVSAITYLDGAINQAVLAMIPRGVDAEFIFQWLQANRFEIIDHYTQGGQPNLSGAIVRSISVPLPPASQQIRIAEALRDADSMIATLERLMAKKQAIKQGVMQQLLTGKTRLPGFSGKWHSAHLGTLGTLIKGRGIRRDDVRRSGVPCIRYGEIYTTYQGYTGTTVSFVDSSVADTALPIRAGDILFAGSGETREDIGLCVAYTGAKPAVAGGDIVVLRGTGFNPVFLSSALNTPIVANQKARLCQGDAVVHISSRALASIEVRVPTQAEQAAIAEVIVDMDAELELLSRRLIKARAMKQGMMQELLTGRTRLPVREGVS